jgi:hypothetical protein
MGYFISWLLLEEIVTQQTGKTLLYVFSTHRLIPFPQHCTLKVLAFGKQKSEIFRDFSLFTGEEKELSLEQERAELLSRTGMVVASVREDTITNYLATKRIFGRAQKCKRTPSSPQGPASIRTPTSPLGPREQ